MGERKYSGNVLALALSTLCACSGSEVAPSVPSAKIDGSRIVFPSKSPQLNALKLESVVERDGVVHRLTGRLTWDEDRTVRIFTPFAGRIDRIFVHIGDGVRPSQGLATIASPDFGQTQADLRKAAADFSLAEKTLARQRDLLAHGVVSAKDFQSAEADYQRANAELVRVRARAALYGKGSGDQGFLLRTPLAGIVVDKNVNPGQEVRPDQLISNMPALFVVTDPTRLWVQLDATEHDAALLSRGQSIVLRTPTYPDERFEARIESIADFIDPATRVVKVRASLGNADRKLKSEMFVVADIREEGRPPVLTMPSGAAFLVGTKHYAFVERGQGDFERVQVSVGSEIDGIVSVTEGLAPGQRVVTSGSLLLEQMLESGS